MACGPTEGRCAAELTRARSGAKRWRPVCRCPCLAFCRGPLGCGADRGATAWRTLTPAEWRSRSTHASPAVPALLVLALDGAVESLLFDSNAPTPPSPSLFISACPALLVPTAARSGPHARLAGSADAPQMHSFGLAFGLELRPAGACPVSGEPTCCCGVMGPLIYRVSTKNAFAYSAPQMPKIER